MMKLLFSKNYVKKVAPVAGNFFERTCSSHKHLFFSESDLIESFVCGWGPGGQKINKTANCVILKHVPSGIVVKCQDSRELHRNRQIARERLNDKLDVQINGENSKLLIEKRQNQMRDLRKHNEAKIRLEAKLAFKKREGLTKE